MLRKFYGGNGGCLPPTDPRLLAMTPEQISLEFEHIKIDQKLRDLANGKKVYEDDEYDKYDQETDEIDSQLSDLHMPAFNGVVDSAALNNADPDDWVDEEYD